MRKILSTAPLAIISPSVEPASDVLTLTLLEDVFTLNGTPVAASSPMELAAWLEGEKKDLDEELANSQAQFAEGVTLASVADTPIINAVDTQAQVAIPPPASGGGSEGVSASEGGSFPPWAWTVVGVGVIAGVDAYDRNKDDDDNDSSDTNASPVFDNGTQSVTALNNVDTEITANATDADGDTVTYNATDPANGSVVQDADNPGVFIYTPDSDYVGSDSFIISASDGKGTPAGQVVNITVAEPVASYVLSANSPSVTEDDVDTVQMTLELTLDTAAFAEDVVVNVLNSGGSATAGEDYTAIDTQLTFAAGETSATLTIDVLPDTVFEGDETIEFTISGERLDGDVTATATITDNDPDTEAPVAPSLALVAESDTGDSNSDGITNDTTPSFAITAESGASVEVFVDGESVGSATESGDTAGLFMFDSAELEEGDFSVTATATDAAGNISALSLADDITIDTSAPTIAAFSVDASTDTATVQFSESIANVTADDFSFLLNDAEVDFISSELLGEDSIRFTLDADIIGGDTVDVAAITAAVSDIAGNSLTPIDFTDDPGSIVV